MLNTREWKNIQQSNNILCRLMLQLLRFSPFIGYKGLTNKNNKCNTINLEKKKRKKKAHLSKQQTAVMIKCWPDSSVTAQWLSENLKPFAFLL